MRPEPREPGDSAIACPGEQVGPEHTRAALEKVLLTLDEQTSEVHDPNVTKKAKTRSLCRRLLESHLPHRSFLWCLGTRHTHAKTYDLGSNWDLQTNN